MNAFQLAPPAQELSRVTQAAARAYEIYILIAAPQKPREEPLNLELIEARQEVRDLKREIARLNAEIERKDLALSYHRGGARKTIRRIDFKL